MTTRTMYHVTDASNVDEIMENGLQLGADDMIYFTETVEDAEFLGEAYPLIEDPVVIAAEVLDEHIRSDGGRMTDVDRLAELIAETTAARGVDRYAVEEAGLSAADWAEKTDRSRSTVARNVRRARRQ